MATTAPLRALVFAKYGDRAASTRQRFVQAMPYLAAAGITLEIRPLFDNAYLTDLFEKGIRNRWRVLKAYLKRLRELKEAKAYDLIIIQYELFPYLPALFESLLSTQKPIILDYDDAIFHQYDQHRNPLVRSILGKKLIPLMRRARLILCGNDYLAEYAKQHNRHVAVVPTVVDVGHYHPTQGARNDPPVLGWIGSPSTWDYCLPLLDTLSQFTEKGALFVEVVGAGHKAKARPGFEFLDWSEKDEINDIRRMDIGIMPIPDAPWARGKCGYKLIQYMACGLPVIASPVGVNRQIVTHGEQGFLASTPEEWKAAIQQLLSDDALRKRMGEAGRTKAVAEYSIQRYGPRLAELLRAC